MANEIKIFSNEEFGNVRIIDVNGDVLFCLKDLCEALGLTAKGVNQRLDDEVVSNYPIIDSLGRTQSALFVNEDGMYDVILESRKPEAKKFRKWITSEVLPSIRKTVQTLETVVYKGNIDGIVFSKNGVPITTSRCIAEYTGKEHKNVTRDIRKEIEDLHRSNLSSEIIKQITGDFREVTYISENGQTYIEYELGEMATMQIMLKYASEYRARFIVAFQEMKKALENIFKARVIESVLPQDSRSRQYIYIIKNPDNDRIKIGVSNNVEKRIATLETGAGTKLDLIYKSLVCSNAFNIERDVHKYFEEYRIFGEWFSVNENEVINFLEQQEYILKSEFAKYISLVS